MERLSSSDYRAGHVAGPVHLHANTVPPEPARPAAALYCQQRVIHVTTTMRFDVI